MRHIIVLVAFLIWFCVHAWLLLSALENRVNDLLDVSLVIALAVYSYFLLVRFGGLILGSNRNE